MATSESVKVAVRVRLFNQREKDANSKCIVRMKGPGPIFSTELSYRVLLRLLRRRVCQLETPGPSYFRAAASRRPLSSGPHANMQNAV